MIPPFMSRTTSKTVVRASTYIRPIEQDIVDPLIKFLNKDYRINKPVSSFADLYMQSPEQSYAVSHGVIGQKLDIVSK